MRPGSSVIELTMFGFEELAPGVQRGPHIQYPRRNMFVSDARRAGWGVSKGQGSAAACVREGAPAALQPTSPCSVRPASSLQPRHPWPAQDEDTQVQWWKLLTCDPQEGRSWTPGEMELERRAAGLPPDTNLGPKYRNFIVRWEGLDTALRAIVDTAGDMDAYRRRWQDGTWWWLTTHNETVPAGPSWYGTCRKARAAGMIH